MLKKISLISILIALLAFVSAAQERLVLIGGGKRTPAVMSKFAELGGKEKGIILVITWASGEPAESFEAFKADLEKASPTKIENAPVAPLNAATRGQFLEQLKTATGVFFTGGDQNRVTEVLKDETLLTALKEKYKSGAVFGGTSAGAAIMSHLMITGEGDFTVVDGAKVQTKNGLGLLPGAIVDQHFIRRQRQNRLLGLVLQNPRLVGIGVDEDTAFVVSDNRYGEVLGESQVMILDAGKGDEFVRLFLLKSGERFDLKKRKKLRAKRDGK